MYDKAKDNRVLISGSLDFSLKVWDLGYFFHFHLKSFRTSKLIKVFNYHSQQVQIIFRPPKEVSSRLGSW
jgi:hypothetical protein